MAICFPFISPTAWGGISSGSKLLHPFALPRAIRAAQIFILEFSKDVSADLVDEFADGAFSNQPVILQVCVGLSSGQVCQRYCQVQSHL